MIKDELNAMILASLISKPYLLTTQYKLSEILKYCLGDITSILDNVEYSSVADFEYKFAKFIDEMSDKHGVNLDRVLTNEL
jgi:hypothetical protein